VKDAPCARIKPLSDVKVNTGANFRIVQLVQEGFVLVQPSERASHVFEHLSRSCRHNRLRWLEKPGKSTSCSRSFLVAEALNDYLDVNEWQVEGSRRPWHHSTAARSLHMAR